MARELVVSSTRHETRLGILEDDQLVEIYIERESDQGLAGSIHKGRVTRVLPGMQSAFVDVGLERDAFLYVSDFLDTSADFEEGEDEPVASKGKVPKDSPEAAPEAGVQPEAEGAESSAPQSDNRERREGNGERGGRRRRSRRGRRRGGRGRDGRDGRGGGDGRGSGDGRGGGEASEGLPESKYASLSNESGEKPSSESSEIVESKPSRKQEAEPEGGFELLPGESLAKYGEASIDDSSETEASFEPAGDREPEPPSEDPFATEVAAVADPGPAEDNEEADDGADREPESEATPDEAGGVGLQSAFSEDDSSDDGGEDDGNDEDDSNEAETGEDVDPDDEDEEEKKRIDFSQHLAEAERMAALIEEQEEQEAGPESEDAESGDDGDENTEGLSEPSDSHEPEITEFRSDEDDEEPAEEALQETSSDEPVEDAEDARGENSAGIPGQPLTETNEEAAAAAPQGGDDQAPSMPGQPETATVRGDRSGSSRNLQRRGRRGRRRGGRSRDRQSAREERAPEPRPREVRVEAETSPVATTGKITDMLQKGNEILVQIAKEPLGKKGARITSHIALPGRYLVYMPTVDHVGVSRKIGTFEERKRLRQVVRANRTGMPGGFIVRTAGGGIPDEEIRGDMLFLYNLWLDIRQKSEDRKNPGLVHQDLDIVERILRDQLDEDFKTIWVDSEDEYERILRFVERFQPSLLPRVKLYTRRRAIFEEFNVKSALEKAMRPKVWLKSGGYIVINQTEALVAVDVNTGKYVGKSDRLEDTIVNTNVEAAKEVVRQVRLRDLGGIIVVDFIDMDDRKNRQKVLQTLEQAMQSDPAPSKSLAFNDFGLVAITRKRVKQSLERTLCSPCSACSGSGHLKSVTTVIFEILAEAQNMAPGMEPQRDITLRVNPEVGRTLKSRKNSYLQELETILKSHIVVRSDQSLHREKYDIGH